MYAFVEINTKVHKQHNKVKEEWYDISFVTKEWIFSAAQKICEVVCLMLHLGLFWNSMQFKFCTIYFPLQHSLKHISFLGHQLALTSLFNLNFILFFKKPQLQRAELTILLRLWHIIIIGLHKAVYIKCHAHSNLSHFWGCVWRKCLQTSLWGELTIELEHGTTEWEWKGNKLINNL